jgi:hypothetical protein
MAKQYTEHTEIDPKGFAPVPCILCFPWWKRFGRSNLAAQVAGMISRALISGFSILDEKVMSREPSVTSTSTVSM